jgi:hypothetical protein
MQFHWMQDSMGGFPVEFYPQESNRYEIQIYRELMPVGKFRSCPSGSPLSARTQLSSKAIEKDID